MYRISLSKHVWDIKYKYSVDTILKMDIFKRAHNYKAGNKFYLLRIEKFTFASYSNAEEDLRNLNGYRHKNKWLLNH